MVLSLPACWLCCLTLLGLACASTDTDTHRDAFVGYQEKSQGALRANKACFDEDASCDDWASKGECKKNPKFMFEKCRLACKDCKAMLPEGRYYGRDVVMQTEMGRIRIRLLWDSAPETCDLVAELASRASCAGCRFYRNEAVPQVGNGPPYALLQGSLGSLLKRPPREVATTIRRGHIATITDTKEFYIALAGHEDWSQAHTAWGEVFGDDMAVVDSIVATEFTDYKHPQYGTVMRMMKSPISFDLALL